MGRTPTFDQVTAVRSARDLFWDRGYDAASIADIEAATGLARSSIYHAFGSKRGLFDATVADYLATVVHPRLAPLQAAGAGRAELRAYFSGLAAAVGALPADAPTRGCLLLSAVSGIAAHDAVVGSVVDAYRADLTAALRHALAGAATARIVADGGAIPSALAEITVLPDTPAPADHVAEHAETQRAKGAADAPADRLDRELAASSRLLASLVVAAMVVARINSGEAVELLATGEGLVDDRISAVILAGPLT